MNIAVRIALVITTLICAICIYVITDYRGKLKAAELTAASIKESASKKSTQFSRLESSNLELKNKLVALQADVPNLMAQIELGSNMYKQADAASKEKSKQLADQKESLNLVRSERDKFREAAKNLQQLETVLAAYQRLGTVAQLQALKNQTQKNHTTSGEPVQGSHSGTIESRVKAKSGVELGMILSVDTKLGFCVINCGSNKGVVKGDQFDIHRAGNFVGKIKIDEVRPAVSIGTAVRKFTPKGLRAGDKVVQGE